MLAIILPILVCSLQPIVRYRNLETYCVRKNSISACGSARYGVYYGVYKYRRLAASRGSVVSLGSAQQANARACSGSIAASRCAASHKCSNGELMSETLPSNRRSRRPLQTTLSSLYKKLVTVFPDLGTAIMFSICLVAGVAMACQGQADDRTPGFVFCAVGGAGLVWVGWSWHMRRQHLLRLLGVHKRRPRSKHR